MPAFSDLLREALAAKDMAGLTLAKIAGCAQTSVSFATTGKDAPREEMALRWAEILGVAAGRRQEWMQAAAAQRASRMDIEGRAGGRRLAQRIERLETEARQLRLLVGLMIEASTAPEHQKRGLLALVERELSQVPEADLAGEVEAILSGKRDADLRQSP